MGYPNCNTPPWRGGRKLGGVRMKQYVCEVCGYVYDEANGDPEHGIAPGTKWSDIPDDWVCPLCGVDKSQFSEVK